MVAVKDRTIPKTTSGKIRRKATKEALQLGTLWWVGWLVGWVGGRFVRLMSGCMGNGRQHLTSFLTTTTKTIPYAGCCTTRWASSPPARARAWRRAPWPRPPRPTAMAPTMAPWPGRSWRWVALFVLWVCVLGYVYVCDLMPVHNNHTTPTHMYIHINYIPIPTPHPHIDTALRLVVVPGGHRGVHRGHPRLPLRRHRRPPQRLRRCGIDCHTHTYIYLFNYLYIYMCGGGVYILYLMCV